MKPTVSPVARLRPPSTVAAKHVKKHFDGNRIEMNEAKGLVGGWGPSSKRQDSDDLDRAEHARAALRVKLDVQSRADGEGIVAVDTQAPETDIERRGVARKGIDPDGATGDARSGTPMLSALRPFWSLRPPRRFL
jgi:hypothetical protein